MAETPVSELHFEGICPDCGGRRVELPQTLPEVGDDFDWQVRDYDGFRLFMLEELAARFPERTRWTPADMEVVLVEQLAAILDQLSDQLDRVAAEAFLETARRPESVRRLLAMIGYDAIQKTQATGALDATETDPAVLRVALEQHWFANPLAMEQARRAGPQEIFTQKRMVTLSDYAERLEDHPLVLRATAWQQWSGSWHSVYVAVIPWANRLLDAAALSYPDKLQHKVEAFHLERGLCTPDWSLDPSIRAILRPYLDAYRMTGQEVILQDAVPVGISMSLSIRVNKHYFQSEVQHSVEQALGTGPKGLFKPGRLRFGEDLHSSDIFETLMALDGVDHVCLNRFKRIGSQYPDQSEAGRIELKGIEVAVCDNEPTKPERGYYRLKLHGGRLG
ncbi:MAG: hypothetical protein KAT20_01150 [Desulfuromonadales bacterium]|nr:hypothetical protein [Desulfuromonadales bacterium]